MDSKCQWIYIGHKGKWEVGCKEILKYKPDSDYQFCPYCGHEIQRFWDYKNPEKVKKDSWRRK